MNLNVQIMGRQVTPSQQVILVNLVAAPLLLVAGAGSLLFWSLGASVFVIGMHAAFYNIDAIVTEGNDGYRSQIV